ncbi:MAG: hypothetical protein WCW44_06155, partial [archaeon]
MTPQEDGVSGCFTLTMPQTVLSKEKAMKMLYEIGITELPKPDKGKNYSGKLIFSQILPKNLTMEFDSYTGKVFKDAGYTPEDSPIIAAIMDKVKIVDGKLISGI